MSLKDFVVISWLVAGCCVSSDLSAQSTPAAPRPAPPQPSDPAKPVGPPEGKTPSTRLPVTIGAPSGGAAKETTAKEPTTNSAAISWIEQAGHDGAVEIELAKLAQTKATRADVRAYAQMLAADHQKIHDELMAIAKAKNVTISTDLTPNEEITKQKLEGVNGMAFDSNYISTTLKDQTKAVSAFAAATRNADPDVKAFAAKTLPMLKHHLEDAQKLAKDTR